jgi:hypothetical protein
MVAGELGDDERRVAGSDPAAGDRERGIVAHDWSPAAVS